MINSTKITEAADIITDTVKPYEKTRPYLDTGGLQLSDIQEIKHFSYNEKPSRANLNIKSGDLILARMQSTVKARLIIEEDEDLMISTGFLVLRPVKSTIEPAYLYHIITSPYFQKEKDRLCSGSTQKSINNSNFKKLSVPLPPLKEQKNIATILDAAYAYRDKTKALIEKYDELMQSLFRNMFDVKEKNLNKWKEVAIQDIAANHKGSMRTGPFGSDLLHSEFVSEGIPVLGIDNAVLNRFQWKERRFITLEKYNKLKRYTIFPNDIIITIMGTVGRVAVIPDNIGIAINTKHLAAITLNNEVANPHFIAFSLLNDEYIRQQIKSQGKGAIMEGLNLTIIKGLRLFLPQIEIQNLFAERVAQIEKQKQQAEASLVKAEELFSSLLQRAFKGELNS